MTGEFMTGEFGGAAAAGAGPTVGELFRIRAQIQPADAAIEYQGRQISYGQLLSRVERATAMLSTCGAAATVSLCCRATGLNISRSNWRQPIWASSPPA
jgi:hypothetical protein